MEGSRLSPAVEWAARAETRGGAENREGLCVGSRGGVLAGLQVSGAYMLWVGRLVGWGRAGCGRPG